MNLESIWKEYRLSLHRFLSSKIDNHADVDDLLQTILIKTHTHLGTLKSEDRIKPWLFQIANRTIIDFYRQRAIKQNVEVNEFWYEEYQEDDLLICVEPFINALPKKHAALLKNIELRGQSQKDYAMQHNISYSTLKSRLKRSRQELKKLFEQCCTLELDKDGQVMTCDDTPEGCNSC